MSNQELCDQSKNIEQRIPIAFYCPQGVVTCGTIIISQGKDVRDARSRIPEDQVPSCAHGKMHSAPITR